MAVFAVLVSAAASSLFRSTAAATAAAYLALAACASARCWSGSGGTPRSGTRTVEAALTINPVAAALHASDTPGFTDYELLPANWYVIGAAACRPAGRSWRCASGNCTGRSEAAGPETLAE